MKSPEVKTAPATAKAEQAIYCRVLQDTGPMIGKELQAADCQAASANCSDVAELEKLHRTYAETQGPAAEAARQSAYRICRVASVKLTAALHNLIDATLTELSTLSPEIEGSEVDFFDKFGFPHQMTGLSGHLNHIRNRVAHHKTVLEMNAGAERAHLLPGDGSEISATFTA